MSQIIERAETQVDYGKPAMEAIIDHPVHGRIYLSERFGGENTIQGGTTRWRHGIACRLSDRDTLASLAESDETGMTVKSVMLEGYDRERKLMDWSGREVEQVAQAAGL